MHRMAISTVIPVAQEGDLPLSTLSTNTRVRAGIMAPARDMTSVAIPTNSMAAFAPFRFSLTYSHEHLPGSALLGERCQDDPQLCRKQCGILRQVRRHDYSGRIALHAFPIRDPGGPG